MPTAKRKATKAKKSPPKAAMASSRKMDAIQLLKKDHQTAEMLFEEIEGASERAWKQKQNLFEKLKMELSIHAKIEEEIFYPALRELGKEGNKMAAEAKEEHSVMKILLKQISQTDPRSEEFDAKMKVLKENTMHHAKEEEEKKIFKECKASMEKEELMELGMQLMERKEALKASGDMDEMSDDEEMMSEAV